MNTSQRLRHLLIDHAKRKSTVSYMELSATLNVESDELGNLLDEVSDWCLRNKVPLLPSIAVRTKGRGKGLPGPGFWRSVPEAFDLSNRERKSLAYVLQKLVFFYYANTETSESSPTARV